MVFRRAAGPMVLVAHGSEEMSQHIGGVLLAEGLSPLRAANGNDTVRLIERDYASVYTSPDTTDNRAGLINLGWRLRQRPTLAV